MTHKPYLKHNEQSHSPHSPQHQMTFEWQPSTTPELLAKLHEHVELKPRGRAFKQSFPLTTRSGQHKTLVSWRFNEWDYGKPHKVQLPSHARGLFTFEGDKCVVVRGYDKFFNVDEVPMTRWDWLTENTKGPYIVTAKENGCIVFFSGLEDGTIVVCSKHSYGTRTGITRNHATAGEDALTKQLEAKGIEMEEFAKSLYEMNCTAVAELCDDSFEEHVVEYTTDRAGLYLHGLNTNQPLFETRSMTEVDAFANKFGFNKTEYFEKDSVQSLREELEEAAKVGYYNGRETEGFVIRCLLKTGEDYFFKFKFEEPYLMYRQWREVTKKYISSRSRQEIKLTKHKYITNKYLDFVIPILDKDEQLCERYQKGFGIISLRKKFLEDYGMSPSDILTHERIQELEELNTAMEELKVDETTKFVLVPIATIGCGKTTTAMTISGCYPDEWAVVINDDVPNGKNGPTEFVKRGLTHLREGKRVVVLDRNNHQIRERQQIIDTVRRLKEEYLTYNTSIQFVCLNFVKDNARDAELWEVSRERVFSRGDNHQSIKAASEDPVIIEKIMKGFIGRFQPCEPTRDPDAQFDLIIDLDVGKNSSSLQNANVILKALHEKYPMLVSEMPSGESLEASFEKALNFTPTFTKFAPKAKKTKQSQPAQPKIQKDRSPVYFSIDIPTSTLLPIIESQLSANSSSNSLLTKLKSSSRVQDEFHVTTCHMNQSRRGSEREKKIWSSYTSLISSKKSANEDISTIVASLRLDSLVWDDKAMCVVVRDIRFRDQKHHETEVGLEIANEFGHATIGTADESIKPFYSNELAKKANDGEEGVTVLKWEDEVVVENAHLKVNY